MDKVGGLVAAMCTVVPQGRASLDQHEISLLRPLTRLLLSESPESEAEYLRYLAIRDRFLPVPMGTVGGWVKDKTILVTGGTGCIGSALIGRLSGLRAGRIVSVSRGVTRGWPKTSGAEYVYADVRDEPALMSVVADVRPDVVFHVAAQRDPGLAERAVHRTVTTNVLGTRNVIAAAERAGVPRIVFASTGKTVIPYTPDVYPASKRIAEWLAANAARRGDILCSAARFTHIVDNSIVHQRISEGCESGLVRIHGPHSVFYTQSALESAQLLICAGLEARGAAWACMPSVIWAVRSTCCRLRLGRLATLDRTRSSTSAATIPVTGVTYHSPDNTIRTHPGRSARSSMPSRPGSAAMRNTGTLTYSQGGR